MAGKRGSHRKWRELRAIVLSRSNICGDCGGEIDMSLSGMHPDGPTVDHIVPVSQGGTDDLSNLQPAHRRCNLTKGAPLSTGPNAW